MKRTAIAEFLNHVFGKVLPTEMSRNREKPTETTATECQKIYCLWMTLLKHTAIAKFLTHAKSSKSRVFEHLLKTQCFLSFPSVGEGFRGSVSGVPGEGFHGQKVVFA